MANSVDPDQTAPEQSVLGPHCLLLYLIRQLFAAENFSKRHFQMHFFLGALRVNFLLSTLVPSVDNIHK